jgi:hypothetical protein
METITLQQKGRRKALLVLPFPVICFATLLFHVLGGATADAGTNKTAETGLNKKLPDARMKKDQPLNKLAYYNQAAVDSAKERQLRLTDPYGGFKSDSAQSVNQPGNLSFPPRHPGFAAGNSPQANAQKIGERINSLQQLINRPDKAVTAERPQQVDIPEPLTKLLRKRVHSIPLHFDHAIFLDQLDKFKNSLTQPIGLISAE